MSGTESRPPVSTAPDAWRQTREADIKAELAAAARALLEARLAILDARTTIMKDALKQEEALGRSFDGIFRTLGGE